MFVARKMLKTSAVKKLMLDTDRAFYCPRDPYQDTPQSIGYDATISAPHMVILNILYIVFLFGIP